MGGEDTGWVGGLWCLVSGVFSWCYLFRGVGGLVVWGGGVWFFLGWGAGFLGLLFLGFVGCIFGGGGGLFLFGGGGCGGGRGLVFVLCIFFCSLVWCFVFVFLACRVC